jgi:hypothetical protein
VRRTTQAKKRKEQTSVLFCSVCHHDAKANDVWTIALDAAVAKAASVRTISGDEAGASVAAKHKRNAWTITMGAGDNPRCHPCHRSHALHEPAATAAAAGGVSEIAVLPPAASLDPRGALHLGPVAFRIPLASRLSSRQLQPPVSFLGKQVVPFRW